MCTGERGRLWEMDIRPCAAKMRQLIRTVASEAESKDEMAKCVTVALMREHLVPDLKQYVETTRRFKYRDFFETCEEWERSQPRGTLCLRRTKPHPTVQRYQNSSYTPKKPVTCFSCGKRGHMAKECRTRPQAERVSTPVSVETPVVTSNPPPKSDLKEVTCFRCRQKGHKAPNCPRRPKGNRIIKCPQINSYTFRIMSFSVKLGSTSCPLLATRVRKYRLSQKSVC